MTEMETLASEFQQMKIALQEIGVVGNAYGKTAGVIEKQQGKLSAAFHKTPVVQLAKQFKGIGKQMKIFGKLVAGNTSLSEEEIKEQKKKATSLTKLTIAMANATFFGNLMAEINDGYDGYYVHILTYWFRNCGSISCVQWRGDTIAGLHRRHTCP